MGVTEEDEAREYLDTLFFCFRFAIDGDGEVRYEKPLE